MFFQLFLLYLLTMNVFLSAENIPYFNNQIANSSVWYAADASCSKESYYKHVWTGPCTGFIYKGLIYDAETDTQGYFGIQPSTKQIWIVYRGTISKLNWLDDAEAKLVDAEYADCSGKYINLTVDI